MIKKIFLIIILIIISTQGIFAITANSSSYSVNMFGTSLATSNISSTNYTAISLSEVKGTTRDAESSIHTANIGFFENTSYYKTVSIISYSISPTSAVAGSNINLYISALNAQNVWAKIIYPNSQEETVSLTNNDITTYSSPSTAGTYTVIFYANSSVGSIASVVDSFVLTEQSVTPPSPGGGNGGSVSEEEEECTYDWDCTDWSICINGTQTRECTNLGTCNGTEGKPEEQKSCKIPLFDIKIKDIEVTKEKTLKFNIDLFEKADYGRIEVKTKCMVIKEGEEIFSQIETLNVEGRLIYGKEIKELTLEDGNYILRVEIVYGEQQKAFAEQGFEVKKEKTFFEKYKIWILSAILLVLIILFIIFWKKYRKENKCKKILKILLIGILIGTLTLIGTRTTGFATNNIQNNPTPTSLIILIILIFGMFLFSFRKKISEVIESKTKKYSKNSIKGLKKKKVYNEEGEYIGKVENIYFRKNTIDSLKIKLNKKQKTKAKGIIIKYKKIKSVGEIIILPSINL